MTRKELKRVLRELKKELAQAEKSGNILKQIALENDIGNMKFQLMRL